MADIPLRAVADIRADLDAFKDYHYNSRGELVLSTDKAAVERLLTEIPALLGAVESAEQRAEDWEAAAHGLAKDELDLGECIFKAILELENGEHATAGRDFGRGISYATKLMRERLHEYYESRESDASESPEDASRVNEAVDSDISDPLWLPT